MKRTTAYEFLKGQWLTQEEAAEILAVSGDTVRRRADAGELKRRYDGRTPKICAYSVQMYMNNYAESPTCSASAV